VKNFQKNKNKQMMMQSSTEPGQGHQPQTSGDNNQRAASGGEDLFERTPIERGSQIYKLTVDDADKSNTDKHDSSDDDDIDMSWKVVSSAPKRDIPVKPKKPVKSKQVENTKLNPPSWRKGSNAKFNFKVYAYVSEELEKAADEEAERMKKDHEEGHVHSHDGHKHDHEHDHDHDHENDNEPVHVHDVDCEDNCTKHLRSSKKAKELQRKSEMMAEMLKNLTLKKGKGGKAEKASKATATIPKPTSNETSPFVSRESLTPSKPPVKRLIGDSKVHDPDRPFELRIGLGFSVPMFEKCVKTMKVGERARFLCMPEECDVSHYKSPVVWFCLIFFKYG
jgi:hypothetical protein